MKISFCIVILYFQSTFDILRELASPILFQYISIQIPKRKSFGFSTSS